jgi:hypothetical protein
VPSVQHSVKGLCAESLTLPSAALGKDVFAECPTKCTRQRMQHSAKPRIPVVILLFKATERRYNVKYINNFLKLNMCFSLLVDQTFSKKNSIVYVRCTVLNLASMFLIKPDRITRINAWQFIS